MTSNETNTQIPDVNNDLLNTPPIKNPPVIPGAPKAERQFAEYNGPLPMIPKQLMSEFNKSNES